MPEPTLPDRLVTAAEQAIDRHHRAHLGEAADAVVAVLWELETSGIVDLHDAKVLGTLSNEIEHNAMERENDNRRFRL